VPELDNKRNGMRTQLGAIIQDLRVAIRGFARTPAFTLTALLAIAIGVGAAAAVFRVADRILFRPLPYPHEEQLVSLGFTAHMEQQGFLRGADYYEWRRKQTAFAGHDLLVRGCRLRPCR
jgi:putative ABC transport system permease protein